MEQYSVIKVDELSSHKISQKRLKYTLVKQIKKSSLKTVLIWFQLCDNLEIAKLLVYNCSWVMSEGWIDET